MTLIFLATQLSPFRSTWSCCGDAIAGACYDPETYAALPVISGFNYFNDLRLLTEHVMRLLFQLENSLSENIDSLLQLL
jgi:hypothetical protein